MIHAKAHQNDTVHGYVLAHLAAGANAGDAKAAVAGVAQVVTATPSAGAVLAYIEGKGNHGPVPDRAWHAQLEAIESRIQSLPSRANSYFDWTRHW